jgi:hypothetical protein
MPIGTTIGITGILTITGTLIIIGTRITTGIRTTGIAGGGNGQHVLARLSKRA